VRTSRISANTGGYCQARRKLPKLVAIQAMDNLFDELPQHMRERMPKLPRPALIRRLEFWDDGKW
jgi:hypothetical protein